MHIKLWISALAICGALSACGDTALEQGLMGAGAGVAGAVVLDKDPATGAAIGAAANVLYCQQTKRC